MLVTVTVFEDLLPIATPSKDRLAGERLIAATPMPLRLTCGSWLALVLIVRVPVYSPVAVGLSETVTEHVPPAATAVEHVFVWLKPAALAAILLIVRLAVPLFCTVTWAVAVVFRTSLPKETLVVERAILGDPAGGVTCDGPPQPVKLVSIRTRQAKLKRRTHLRSMESTSSLFSFWRGLSHRCPCCPE